MAQVEIKISSSLADYVETSSFIFFLRGANLNQSQWTQTILDTACKRSNGNFFPLPSPSTLSPLHPSLYLYD